MLDEKRKTRLKIRRPDYNPPVWTRRKLAAQVRSDCLNLKGKRVGEGGVAVIGVF